MVAMISLRVIQLKGRVQCCNEQVFCPNLEKKFGADPSCQFRENAKTAHFNSEK